VFVYSWLTGEGDSWFGLSALLDVEFTSIYLKDWKTASVREVQSGLFILNLYVKQRLYIDTSVFGGFFDEEFAEFTKPLFNRILNGEFILFFSAVTEEELINAPVNVRELVTSLKTEHTEFIDTTGEAVDLANSYIAEKVVGQTSYADCLHIALATINRADYLISWNFKHIVNIQRIQGYNLINIKYGYNKLEIRSPRDFMIYENNN